MTRNWYYGKQADIVNASAEFSSLITATPTAYGLVAGQATAFAALNSALQTSYAAAISNTTRSPVTVQANRLAIRNVQHSASLLAKVIYATSTVTDAQLLALGLLPRRAPLPRPVPDVAPVLELVAVMGRTAKIRYHNSEAETSRGKAKGTVGVALYSHVGALAPADPSAYKFEGLATRSVTEIIFPDTVASGAKVWISGQWVSARGQTSIGSAPITFNLPGGDISAAA